MPIYDFQCEKCDHVTAVSMKMSEYTGEPPTSGCEKCGAKEMYRKIQWKKEQTGLVWGGTCGWHNEIYSRTRSIK